MGDKFIPALGFERLTPLYDLFVRLVTPEMRLRMRFLDFAGIGDGQEVLDVGCGTGTLLALAARRHQSGKFVGIDPDPRVLARARRKTASWRDRVRFEQGSAAALPFEDASFDRVLSTLAFHHLALEEKRAAMREIHRVLRPGGEFHLADFGPPHTRLMRVLSFLTTAIGHEHVTENFAGRLPPMLEEAGFVDVVETGRFGSIFGAIRALRAVRPR